MSESDYASKLSQIICGKQTDSKAHSAKNIPRQCRDRAGRAAGQMKWCAEKKKVVLESKR